MKLHLPAGFACIGLVVLFGCGSIPPTPPLHMAVKSGDLDEVRKLAGQDGAVAERDPSGLTALHVALQLGRREVALELISRGSDVNARSRDGSTPLSMAVDKDYVDVVDQLLSRRATLEFFEAGPSPLFDAVRRNNLPMADRLLRAGAKASRRNFDGETPLHVAANRGYVSMIGRLLDAGADVDAAMPDGRTPMHQAALNNAYAAVDLLYAKGAKVTTAEGETGVFCSAVLHRHIAQRDYMNGAVALAEQRLERARATFLLCQSTAADRASQLASDVAQTQLLNVMALFVGAVGARLDAKTSITGYGERTVPIASTTSREGLRDSYRGIARYCELEAEKAVSVSACIRSTATNSSACFATKDEAK
jgi:ankyrin repeat protein